MKPGTRLGHYEIRSKIGAGGMGEVYLAIDTELDRTVAIKILPAVLAADGWPRTDNACNVSFRKQKQPRP